MTVISICVLLFVLGTAVYIFLSKHKKKKQQPTKKRSIKAPVTPVIITSRKVCGSPRRGNK